MGKRWILFEASWSELARGRMKVLWLLGGDETMAGTSVEARTPLQEFRGHAEELWHGGHR